MAEFIKFFEDVYSLGYTTSYIKLIKEEGKKDRKFPLREFSHSCIEEQQRNSQRGYLNALDLSKKRESDYDIVCLDYDENYGSDTALYIREIFNPYAYIERSLSGNLHVFVKVRSGVMNHHVKNGKFLDGKLEVYYQNRYVALTGDFSIDCACEFKDATDLLLDFCKPLEKKTGENVYGSAMLDRVRKDEPETVEIERARKLLSFLDADDRENWWRIPSMLKEMIGESGCSLYHDWSSKSNKYGVEDTQKKWDYKELTRLSGWSLLNLVSRKSEEGKRYVATLGEYEGKGKFKSDFKDCIALLQDDTLRSFYKELCGLQTDQLPDYNTLVDKVTSLMNKEFCLLSDTLIHKQQTGATGGVRMTKGFPDSLAYLRSFPYVLKKNEQLTRAKLDVVKMWKASVDADIRQGVLRFYPSHDKCDSITEEDYNSWRGFAAEKYEERDDSYPAIFESYVRDCLAVESEEAAEYLLNWLAHLIQKPFVKPKVAVAIRSTTTGVGKSLLADIMRDVVGQAHFIETNGASSLISNHNEELASKLFVFGDECMFAGDPRIVNSLKTRITEDHTTVNPKGRDVYTIDSYARYYLVTNELQAIRAHDDERRFLMLDATRSKHRQDRAYFKRVAVRCDVTGRVHKGRVRSLYEWLKNRDIEGFSASSVVKTDALEQQKKTAAIFDNPLKVFVNEIFSEGGDEMLEMDYDMKVDYDWKAGVLIIDKKSFLGLYSEWNSKLSKREQHSLNRTTMKQQLFSLIDYEIKSKIKTGKRYWEIKKTGLR